MKTSIALLSIVLSVGPAYAGVGGSTSKIESAISSGSVDSIVAELERAENIPTQGAFPAVMKLIDHPSDRVREAAGWWMTRRGLRQDVMNLAATRLAGSDPVAASHVLDTLRGMRDGTTLELVADFAAHPLDEASGIAAFRCLGVLGSPNALPTVGMGMMSSFAGIRAEALRTVRVLRAPVGSKVVTTGAAYLGALNDSDATVRREAALTLGFLGQNGLNPDATSSGLTALSSVVTKDSAVPVRKAAAWALGQMGSPAGLPALKLAEVDADSSVRSVARAAAGNIH